jgi:hypothetical protein
VYIINHYNLPVTCGWVNSFRLRNSEWLKSVHERFPHRFLSFSEHSNFESQWSAIMR